MNESMNETRESLLRRAAALDWPVVGVSGNAVQGEARWRRAVAGAFPVELDQIAQQLQGLEAAHAERAALAPVRSAFEEVPMMDADELAAQQARRDQDAGWLASERARQAEALRQKILADHGII